MTPVKLSPQELAELDQQWAAINSGEPTVPHDDVARWLETWGTPELLPWQQHARARER